MERFRYQEIQFDPYFSNIYDVQIIRDVRVIPFTLSILFFSFQFFHIVFRTVKDEAYTASRQASLDDTSFGVRLKQRIQALGGYTISMFMLTRFIGSLVLLTFSTWKVLSCEVQFSDLPAFFGYCPELFWTITFLYTTLSSLLPLLSIVHGKLSTVFNILVLLSALIVYMYRDIWPLATYTKRPADEEEGPILFFKIGILTIIGLFIPMFIPRKYTPVDPNNPMAVPNPEQTASFFSMMLYSYLDPLILLGYRVAHLGAENLAPLSDRDDAKYRREKGFPHLDVFHGKKRISLFWGLMRVFRKEYIILVFTIFGYSFGGFASPIGINRLLSYMESRGADATVRPWFWILWLVIGPMLQSLSVQWYLFITTRTLVRTEGLITQLVFEHSLRIILKAEQSSSKTGMAPSTSGNTPTESAIVTPDDASATTDGQSEFSESTDAAHSQQSTIAVSQEPSTTSTIVPAKGPLSTKVQSADSKTTSAKDEKSDKPGGDNLIGKINNLVTTDLNNITSARDFLLIILYIPVQITFCTIFLYQVLGWSALVGIASMVILLPLPGIIARQLQKAQIQRMKKTDARVQAVTETVSILRMVKLFGWENKMSERLDKTRQEELQWLWRVKLLEQINGLFGFVYPILTMVLSYALYTVVMKGNLTPSKIFSSMTVFNMLREQFYRLLRQSTDIIQGKVSLDRVEDFLNNTELLDAFLENSVDRTAGAVSKDIGFRNAVFTWSLEGDNSGVLTPSRRQFKLRIKDKLLFKRNGINLIIGPTGSGKTSILMALLGEMHFIASNPDSWFNLPRDGGIAYAAQESWVQNDTIRNNILFRTPYDEIRYKKVIKQCALERDLELFDAGDATEVGERGLTLSGGQKARVTLARAIYSRAEIVLLDDVFAALDVHTSTWIIENCFKGELVQGRTILLVTHNVALTSPIADFIVSIGSDGKVKSQGTELSAALKRDPKLRAEVKQDREAAKIGQADLNQNPPKPTDSDGKLVVAEEIAEGHVTWKSIKLLFSSLGGKHPVIFYFSLVFLLVVVDWSLTSQSWFLGYWGSQYEGHDPSEVKDGFYISIYTTIATSAFLLNFAAYILYVLGSMRASRSINKQLVDSVLGSTLRWLDETPTGRIITRCTQDIRSIDSQLPQNAMWLLDLIIGAFTKLGVVVLFRPLFLFPGLFVGALGLFLGNMYLKAQLSIKRETSNARAPMLSHFSAAIHGLVSIRAYGSQESFKNESLDRINHYTRLARTSWNLNRWIAVRMDLLGAAFTAALASYLIYGPWIGASNTGFTLAMATSLTHIILFLVRIANEFEVNSNSLERIQSYLDIEHEPKSTTAGTPPAAWPSSGDLRVEHLYARYSSTGPNVLNDVSFHIESGQRVGIVGRTGSGKSSLTLALLRCIVTEGTVYYDGIPTNNLNLDALRSNITIIPQTPELLSGTLRQNLDPFDQSDDATLNDALRSAGLFSLQEDGDEGHLTLDSIISGGGANLSVGQRQIIALARAMVRGSKLLVLDEATSAIDYKTDSIIQNTLRTELGSDVTVITVAHRLQTIMDSDRIMVLDNGKLVEFGTPKDLLKKEEGILYGLVEGSGDKDALYKLAGVDRI